MKRTHKEKEAAPSAAEIDQPDFYEIAKAYRPEPDADVGWVLDYAKSRADWVDAHTVSTEERSIGLIKAMAASLAAAWALAVYARSAQFSVGLTSATFAVLGILAIAAAVACCGRVLIPRRRNTPVQETAALIVLQEIKPPLDPRATFAFLMAATTTKQMSALGRKAWWLRAAYWLFAAAIVSLCLSFLLALNDQRRKTTPFPPTFLHCQSCNASARSPSSVASPESAY